MGGENRLKGLLRRLLGTSNETNENSQRNGSEEDLTRAAERAWEQMDAEVGQTQGEQSGPANRRNFENMTEHSDQTKGEKSTDEPTVKAAEDKSEGSTGSDEPSPIEPESETTGESSADRATEEDHEEPSRGIQPADGSSGGDSPTEAGTADPAANDNTSSADDDTDGTDPDSEVAEVSGGQAGPEESSENSPELSVTVDESLDGVDISDSASPQQCVSALEERIKELESNLEQTETELVESEAEVDRVKNDLEETEAELEETRQRLTEVEDRLIEVRSVEPGLDHFSQDEVHVQQYVEALEQHIESLESEKQSKESVIQELKDRESDQIAEAEREAIAEITGEFTEAVREPLRRITETDEPKMESIEITIGQFDEVLSDYEIEVFAPDIGEAPDRERVEVTQTGHSEHASGTVAKVYEVGLERDGTVLKPPEVKLSEGPKPEPDEYAETNESVGEETSGGDPDGGTSAGGDDTSGANGTQADATDETDKTPTEEESLSGDDVEPEVPTDDEHGQSKEAAPEPLRIKTDETTYRYGEKIEVQVCRADGSPVGNVPVTADGVETTKTDEGGRAVLAAAEIGEVTIRVAPERSEYQATWTEVTIKEN